MKVKELVDTCQNQWQKMFNYNPLFKVHFRYKDIENEDEYDIKDFNDYTLRGKTSEYVYQQINHMKNSEVLAWYMQGRNDLYILIKEHY